MATGLNIASDGKLFIDFDNGGAGGGAGAFKLTTVDTVDDTSDRSRENVMAIGVQDAAGTRRKKGGGSLSLTVHMQEGLPEVDWIKLDLDNVIFSLRFEPDNGGRRVTWFGCEVSNAAPKLNSDGNNTYTIVVTYKKRR